jgi:hypothetical protein
MLHHNSNCTGHPRLAVMTDEHHKCTFNFPRYLVSRLFIQHTIRSFLIPVIASHLNSSYLAQLTIWFIALLFWFLDHINGFLLTSLYSKYLVLVLPRAAYLEHYVYDNRDRGELARKKTSSRCQTRRWHTLTTEEQTVPSKWYPLLARDTCVINRSGLQNLLGLSIICKQK